MMSLADAKEAAERHHGVQHLAGSLVDHAIQATVTSIVDRLVERGFVVRSRGELDRRQVWVTVTAHGRAMLSSMPDTMQDRFQSRFARLPDWEQAIIVAMLERLTALLHADGIDAAPVIDAGAIDRIGPA
jgi:hypothetical protein